MKNVPIKFRGVDIETGDFVFGRDIMQYSDTDVWIGDNDLPKNYPVKDVTLLVGYDADGNEVYEGDKIYDAEHDDTVIAELYANVHFQFYKKVDDNV